MGVIPNSSVGSLVSHLAIVPDQIYKDGDNTMKNNFACFKSFISFLLLGAVMLPFTGVSTAQVVPKPVIKTPTLPKQVNVVTMQKTQTIKLNTGLVGQDGTTLTDILQADDDWQVTADPLNNTVRQADVVEHVTAGTHFNWFAPFPESQWISARRDKYRSILKPPRTSFTYKTCFDLDARASAPKLMLQLRADDIIRRVRLNNRTIFNEPDPNAAASAGKPGSHLGPPLSLTHDQRADFRIGQNCLEVVVEDVQQMITGLDVVGSVTYEMCTLDRPVPPDGMVAWWTLEEKAGTTVYDIVGGHNGTTRYNSVTAAIGAGGPTSIAGSYIGNSLQFTWHQEVEVPHSPDLNFGTGDFTIDAWVKYSKRSGLISIVEKRDMQGNGYTFRIAEVYPSSDVRVQLIIGNTAYHGPSVPLAGTWVFVAVVRTGNAVHLYANDNRLTATSPTTLNVSNTHSLVIGFGGSLPVFALDEVEIFNRALSGQELLSIFKAGPAGKCR